MWGLSCMCPYPFLAGIMGFILHASVPCPYWHCRRYTRLREPAQRCLPPHRARVRPWYHAFEPLLSRQDPPHFLGVWVVSVPRCIFPYTCRTIPGTIAHAVQADGVTRTHWDTGTDKWTALPELQVRLPRANILPRANPLPPT